MAEEIASDPQRDRFSVPDLLKDAYLFFFANRRAFLALAIIPMVVSILVDVPALAPPTTETGIGIAWLLFSLIVAMVCVSVFAVAWCRLILLGGRDTQAPVQFRLGRRELRYMLYNVLLFLLAIVIGGLLTFVVLVIWRVTWVLFFGNGAALVSTNGDFVFDDSLLPIAIGVIYITTFAITALMAFVFPAIAVDSFKGLRAAWWQIRGIFWRLFWAIFIASTPSLLLAALSWTLDSETDESAIAGEAGDWLSWLLWTVPENVVYYLVEAITLSIICVVFRRRTGWEPPSVPSAEGA